MTELVVVAGAELFTGNNLLAMGWADKKITSAELLRNWLLVCAANCDGFSTHATGALASIMPGVVPVATANQAWNCARKPPLEAQGRPLPMTAPIPA